MGACELYGATAVVTLAPKSSEPSVYALHPGCFGASVGQQQVFVFRKQVLLQFKKGQCSTVSFVNILAT